ncbi:DUF1631 family protein [Ottowia testudinis]|uniref:DUF1631 family protein n=1 Tax=Ottowia testudinis TaxID=2816950 RepID=A0A975H509_9BURK|nr:DUF1631 family protein [Ottowia testudinis]QTD46876.1 DUF1631 family protein [Ottowia testudinis]
MIKRARQEAVFLSSSLIDRCAEAAVAALEGAERSAKSVALRLQLGEAMAALTKRRPQLRADFPGQVDQAVAQALLAARDAPVVGARGPIADDELSLVEDAEVARFVEASRLQQTVMPVVEQPLSLLDSLISSALGLPVVRAELNPLRPEVMCGALLQLIDRQPEDPELRAHWARHMARPFAEGLRQLYESIAQLLEDQGVEEARYRLKLTEGGAPPPRAGQAVKNERAAGGGGSGAGGAGEGAALPSDADAARQRRAQFPRMSDLAQAQPAVPRALMHDFLYRPQWLAEHDEPLPPNYYEAVQAQAQRMAADPAPQYDAAAAARTRALAKAQSVVERPVREVAPDTPLAPEQWGEAASPQARAQTLMQLKAQAGKISQVLGLDAVRTLVGQVAGDARMLAPVREAFVAMEPALLRMAMADPRFFGDDHHPARRLIEGVAQRSFNYNDEFAADFEQFMAPVRQVVRELNAQPEARAESFATHLQTLEADWKRQDSDDQQSRDDGLRSMHFAQERQALADKIAWEFSLRSDLDRVPAVVADFLFKDWSLVIAHAQLTDERGQLDPGGYLAVVTDLLWSVKREAALKAPARLFEVVPRLVQTLRRGLQMLGKEPHETDTFFDALMRYHHPVLRLRRVRSAIDAEASGFSRLGDESSLLPLETDPLPLERPQPRAADQPWLGRHELAAAGFEDLAEGESEHGPLTGAAPLGDDVSAHGGLHTGPAPVETGADFAATGPRDAAVAPAPATAGFVPLDLPPANAAPAPAAAAPAPAQTAEAPEDVEARTRAQLARLRTGDWVDLKVRGHWRRAQLDWTSDNGALFMFISRGGRPHSMTRRTCEKLIRTRQLRPVDASAVVDKALRQLGDAARTEREPARA